MRRPRSVFLLVTLLAGLAACSPLRQSVDSAPPALLRHVVAFRFKPEVTPEQMRKATEDFLALEGKVPQIVALEGGADIRMQRKMGRFTHAFIVTVKDEADLAAYGAHPDHRAFSASVDPLLAEVVVVDYWLP